MIAFPFVFALFVSLLPPSYVSVKIPLGRGYKVNHRYRNSTSPSSRRLTSDPDEFDLSSAQDMYYYGSVTVGDSTLTLLFDTGSSVLWVPSQSVEVKCGLAGSCNQHERYEPSSQSQSTGENWSIQYGSGAASGQVYSDFVSLGSDAVSLSSFEFGLASTVSMPGYSQEDYDGLIGLGFPYTLRGGWTPVMPVTALFEAGKIKENLFGMYLDPQVTDGSGSELSLGEIDSSRLKEGSSPSYMSVLDYSWWTVNIVGSSMGGTSLLPTGYQELAIVDSGTSLIAGPSSWLQAVYEQIGSVVDIQQTQGVALVDCALVDSLPSISFTLTGKQGEEEKFTFTLTGAQYVVINNGYCELGFEELSGGGDSGFPSFILGDPFMRSFYTIFDYGGRRIGVAPLQDSQPINNQSSPGDAFRLNGSVLGLALIVLSICSAVV